MSEPAPGESIGPWRFDAVTPEAMAEMAVVLDDPNPIHLDAELVASLGMGDREVNQGPSNVGYVLNMLREAWPNGTLEELEVRFLANVFAGDAVVAAGEVEAFTDGRVTCAVWLDVENGERALSGRATLSLR
jgi:acyl dehydratase